MNSLTVLDFGVLRTDGFGKYSVFDLIRICGQKNPYEFWNRLQIKYPDVLTGCTNLKFPGKGQKETPVTDKEGLLKVIGLLPGAISDKYRDTAAKTVLQLLENPDQLAIAAIDRIKGKKELEEVTNKALNKYISTYHPLMGEIRKRDGVSPVTYQHVNTVNTKAIMGKEPHLIKAERGGKTARENATSDELMHLYVLQSIQQKGLQNRDAKGHSEISRTIQEVADDFQNLLGKYGVNLQQLG